MHRGALWASGAAQAAQFVRIMLRFAVSCGALGGGFVDVPMCSNKSGFTRLRAYALTRTADGLGSSERLARSLNISGPEGTIGEQSIGQANFLPHPRPHGPTREGT